MKLIGRGNSPNYSSAAQSAPSSIDDVVAACPYVVRRGKQIVATFANKSDAGNWARDYSNYRDMQSTFVVHTAREILSGYRDGAEVEVP